MLWNHWFSTSFSCTEFLQSSLLLKTVFWHFKTSFTNYSVFLKFLRVISTVTWTYTRGFSLGKAPGEKERKPSTLDEQFLLRNPSIQLAWAISHHRPNHFLFKNDKFFNTANPLDKYAQEYQYTKMYEKQEDHFRIIFFQPRHCLPAFFLILKVRRWLQKADDGWWYSLKITV